MLLIRKRFTVGYQTLDKQDKLWKLWWRRYVTKLLPLHLKWFSRSWTTNERGYISLSIFKAATWVMFCTKHICVKRHSGVPSRNRKKHFRIFFGFEFIRFSNRGVLSAALCSCGASGRGGGEIVLCVLSSLLLFLCFCCKEDNTHSTIPPPPEATQL